MDFFLGWLPLYSNYQVFLGLKKRSALGMFMKCIIGRTAYQNHQNKKKNKKIKMSRGMAILSIHFQKWIFRNGTDRQTYDLQILQPRDSFSPEGKGTQGIICCSCNAASLATLKKQMLSSLAIYDGLSLVITKPSSVWLGSTRVDICRYVYMQI